MSRVLILGSTGMLGQALFNYAKKIGIDVYGMADKGADFNFDVKDDLSLKNLLLTLKPEIVINTIALVSIEKCEQFADLAYLVNTRPVGIISNLCSKINSYFVQISTDHYYSGDGNKKHREDSPVFLVNEYARTKYLAEKLALVYSNSLILRTNIVGFRGNLANPTFVEWVIDSLKEKKEMKLFVDFFTSSIDVKSFAEIFFQKIFRIKPVGVLNFSSREVFSKKDFIVNLAERLNFDFSKHSFNASVFDFNHVPRAESLGLDVLEIEKKLDLKMPTLKSVINNLALEYEESLI